MVNLKNLKEGLTVQLKDKRVMTIETIFRNYIKYIDDNSHYVYNDNGEHSSSLVSKPNKDFNIERVVHVTPQNID